MKFTATALALFGGFLVVEGGTGSRDGRRRAAQEVNVQEIAELHRSRHLAATDIACPRDPYYVDVGTSLSSVPVIDGDGGDVAWDKAKRLEMFKASRYNKMRLGYAYVMFDCASQRWFVKAYLDYPLTAAFCGSDCDHFVKMNEGGVLANPHKDGKYYPNNMGWELSFPSSRAPALGSDISLQVHANVFEDGGSQTAGTESSNNCALIKATCNIPGATTGPITTQTSTVPPDAVCVSTSDVVGTSSATPAQTFFIPMPEELAFNECFLKINREAAKPPVETLIAVSVSTEKTIVWYDHWEDGYDEDDPNRRFPGAVSVFLHRCGCVEPAEPG